MVPSRSRRNLFVFTVVLIAARAVAAQTGEKVLTPGVPFLKTKT